MALSVSTQKPWVLVTGACGGIGKTLAGRFKQAGYNVIGTYAHKKKTNNSCKWLFYLDFTKQESVKKLCKKLKEFKEIQVLINNAGVNIIKEQEKANYKDWKTIEAINLRGPYFLSAFTASKLMKNRGGRIVNIGSIWSTITRKKRSLYTVMKSGLHGLTRAMAVEYASKNILVNTVSPGFTLTELTKNSLSIRERTALQAQIPLKRLAQPKEIAPVVLYLASPQNTFITGQNIFVDGGFSIS